MAWHWARDQRTPPAPQGVSSSFSA